MTLQDITNALLDAGLRQHEIAARAGCSQPTIHRIANGGVKNPRYRIGRALEEMYREHVVEAA